MANYTRGRKGQPAERLDVEVEVARIHWRSAFWQGVWRSIAVVVPSALKYGCIAWGLTKAAQVLMAWTGQDTEASVRLNILVNFLSYRAAGFLAPWLAVLVTWTLYRKEKRLKERALVSLREASGKYESLLDPASNLGSCSREEFP